MVLLIGLTVTSMIPLIWLSNVVFGGFGVTLFVIPKIMINAISVVNLVTAIGFSVEFCVHILLKYDRNVGTKTQRISNALNTMGSSVFSGIFCTKILGRPG